MHSETKEKALVQKYRAFSSAGHEDYCLILRPYLRTFFMPLHHETVLAIHNLRLKIGRNTTRQTIHSTVLYF